MTCEEAVAWIHSHGRFSDAPGLERMRHLMRLLGNPQEKLRFVHVAGTNGKGSTATMLAAALTAAGYRTGLTISPYILDFRERIQIDAQMIPPHKLATIIAQLRPLAERIEGLVEFELVTAVAFSYFAQEQCALVVAEVGLGGRLDATNVIPPPLAAAITSISLDHTTILGDTLAQIAAEKCGIIKTGTAVVTAPDQPVEARIAIRAACAAAGCSLDEPVQHALSCTAQTMEYSHVRYRGQEITLPLGGAHQQQNLLTVLRLCEALAVRGFDRLTLPVIAAGIAQVRFPARLERIAPDVYLDGAHNPGGAYALAATLKLATRCPIGVVGMLADKDSIHALALLAPCFSRIYCAAPDSPRALDAQTTAQRAGSAAISCVDVAQAISQARTDAAREGRVVVVCGSLYLAAEVRKMIKLS